MKWKRKSPPMEEVSKVLMIAMHKSINDINMSFGSNLAGMAALGNAIGRVLVLTQGWHNNHRPDCKDCAKLPAPDFRAVFTANMHEAIREEQALLDERNRNGELAAASFLENVFASHVHKPPEEYKDPKAQKG